MVLYTGSWKRNAAAARVKRPTCCATSLTSSKHCAGSLRMSCDEVRGEQTKRLRTQGRYVNVERKAAEKRRLARRAERERRKRMRAEERRLRREERKQEAGRG